MNLQNPEHVYMCTLHCHYFTSAKVNELHKVKVEGTEWNTRILCLLEETGGGLITVRHTRAYK